MNGGGKIAGPALILVGLLMLLGQMGMPAFGVLWPLILLAIGVGMLLRYRQGGEDSGLVFSGVLLVVATILFLGAKWGELSLARHWPAFLVGVGISFLAMAQVDSKRRDAMVPGWICLGLAAVFYFFTLGLFLGLLKFVVGIVGTLLKVIIPLVLMGFGGWLIFHDRQDQESGGSRDFPEKVSPEAPAEAPAEAAEAPAADPGVEEMADPPPEADVEEEPAAEPAVEPEVQSAVIPETEDFETAEDADFEPIDPEDDSEDHLEEDERPPV